jgi:hypothetical protein
MRRSAKSESRSDLTPLEQVATVISLRLAHQCAHTSRKGSVEAGARNIRW